MKSFPLNNQHNFIVFVVFIKLLFFFRWVFVSVKVFPLQVFFINGSFLKELYSFILKSFQFTLLVTFLYCFTLVTSKPFDGFLFRQYCRLLRISAFILIVFSVLQVMAFLLSSRISPQSLHIKTFYSLFTVLFLQIIFLTL